MKSRRWIELFLMMLLCMACVCSAHAEDAFMLPQALTSIEAEAFEGNKAISHVVLPDDVEKIGSRAFADSGLNEINFPESLNSIAADIFAGCGHVEVHTLNANGLNYIIQLLERGYDVAWADEVLEDITTHSLRAAAGQTIRRVFAAPQGGTYTFTLNGAEAMSIIRYDRDGNVVDSNSRMLTVDLRPDEGAYLGFRFIDASHAGRFSFDVSRMDQPMMDVVYTPELWVCKDDQPVRDVQMDGSLAQLAVGEVLAPALSIQNTGNYRVAGQVSAVLDGKEVDLGFFALGAQESSLVPVPADAAFAAETAGAHTIEYTVEFEGEEKVASMTWNIEGERQTEAQAAVVKQGSNTIELSQAEGNLFKFIPAKTGVYQIGTATKNCDTFASLRDGRTGQKIVSDDDAGSPYRNFMFSRTLKAKEPVYIEIGMKNFKGATDVVLSITYCGTPSLKYSHSLYVFDGGSWSYADSGKLTGSGMIKLKDKGDLSTLEIDEFLTPVMVITNSSGKAVPLGLTAELDGQPILWSNGCMVNAGKTFVAYLDTSYARMHETPGIHTIDYYINGNFATSYTWEVVGKRAPHIFDGTPMLTMGENYRSLDDDDGSFDWFKAPCAGVYRFYSRNSFYNARAILFDEEMNILTYNDGADNDFVIHQYLEAGQVVYLHSLILEDSRDTGKIWIELISNEAAPTKQLSLGSVGMPMDTNEIQTFSFTAPYGGEFSFFGQEGDYNGWIDATLYDKYWREKELSGEGIQGHFSMRCRLEKGETVYLKAVCSKKDSSAVLEVSCYAQQLALGGWKLNISAFSYGRISFVAPYDGTFSFDCEKGTGSGSYTAKLYDANWTSKAASSTGNTGYFSMRCSMKKGEVVNLQVNCMREDPSAVLRISYYGQ